MSYLFTYKGVTRAVLLCGGQDTRLSPLMHGHAFLTPVFNRPLIEYTIDFLVENGITELVISTTGEDSRIRQYIDMWKHKYSGSLNISLVEEDLPKGSAGALRDVKDMVGQDPFLVISGNTYIAMLDMDKLIADHHSRGSVLTVAVKKGESASVEGISLDADGLVKSFNIIHPSRDRRSAYKAVGVYVMSPAALDFISEKGYYDIKEQLIPALRAATQAVHVSELDGICHSINNVDDYYHIHRDCLVKDAFPKQNLNEIAEGVWVGKNNYISPQAYIEGPVVIGSNCKIGDGVQIIGPAVIGDGCTISDHAKIRESILWSDFEMEENSSIKYCIIGRRLKLLSGDSYSHKVIVDRLTLGNLNMISNAEGFNGTLKARHFRTGGAKYRSFLAVKRLIDLAASLLLLPFLGPLILVLAVFIKRDSAGPVFFRQKRCGKNGVDFEMLKFRTMVVGAQNQQQDLASKKDVDGPMFKLIQDPRITRIGKFLRKTSLDELPQILNVLMGDMSLVGPRPLVMNEMKFSRTWRSTRLKVKPGITGLWQVQGRSEASFHDWIRYDVFYVKHQSLWLDVKIMLRTIKIVFNKVGAY